MSASLLLRLADRIVNRPLLVTPDKAMIILDVLSGRIGLDAAPAVPRPAAYRDAADIDPWSGKRLPTIEVHGGVALITIDGSLVNRGAYVGASSGIVSYEGIRTQLVEAESRADVKSVVLDLNTPGGEAGGMFAIARKVREVAQRKRVVAFVNDMAASAGYGIASQASEIVVSPSSLVGSIGVVLMHLDRSGELAQKGVKPTFIHAGAHKVDGNPYEALPANVRADLQAEVDALMALFVGLVGEGRGSKLTAAAARATKAKVFTGQAAIRVGLADRIATFDEVIAGLQGRTAPRSQVASLVVTLVDQASAPAKKAGSALDWLRSIAERLGKQKSPALDGTAKSVRDATAAAKAAARELGAVDFSSRFVKDLQKLKATPAEINKIATAWHNLNRETTAAGMRRGAFEQLKLRRDFENAHLREIVAIRAAREEHERYRNSVSRVAGRTIRMAAGAAGLYGGAHAVERAGRATAVAGAESRRETVREKLAGMTPEEVARVNATAVDLAGKFPSVGMVDIRALARGARNLTGDTAKGLALLPDIVKAQVAIQTATGGSGDGELDQILKSADIAGLQDDPKRFRAFLDNFAKAVQVEGRQLNAGEYLSFFKRAKMAGAGFGDDFIAAAAPSLMQELGGATAGTALATYYQQMAGGRIKKEQLQNQKNAGLRDEKGVLVDRKDFIADPFEWTQKHIKPLLDKQGIDVNDRQSALDFLTPLTSDRNAAEVVAKFILQADQIRRNRKMYGGAAGIDAADTIRQEDPFVAATSAMNALKNAAAALADPALPAATAGLNGMADVLNGLAKKLRDDPKLAENASTVATSAATGAGILGVIRAGAALFAGSGVSGAIGAGLRGVLLGGLGGAATGAAWLGIRGALAIRESNERAFADLAPGEVHDRGRKMQRRANEAARNRILQTRAEVESSANQPGPISPPTVDQEAAAAAGARAGAAAAAGVQFGIRAGEPSIAVAAQGVLDRIKTIFAAGVTVPFSVQGATPDVGEGGRILQRIKNGEPPGGVPPGRASGGRVYAGQLYQVNESRQEFFEPAVDGAVNNGRPDSGTGRATSISPNVSVTANVSVSGAQFDFEELVSATMDAIEKEFRSEFRGMAADVGLEVTG